MIGIASICIGGLLHWLFISLITDIVHVDQSLTPCMTEDLAENLELGRTFVMGLHNKE